MFQLFIVYKSYNDGQFPLREIFCGNLKEANSLVSMSTKEIALYIPLENFLLEEIDLMKTSSVF